MDVVIGKRSSPPASCSVPAASDVPPVYVWLPSQDQGVGPDLFEGVNRVCRPR